VDYSKIVYHIPKKKLTKHIRHSLGTTIVDIHERGNINIQTNYSNKTIYDVVMLKENNFWLNWLQDNTVIA
jgi:hypothetical protein